MSGWSELVLPDARVRVLEAQSGRAAYEIRVWCPPGAPKSALLPVVYVLDGRRLFATVAETVERAARRPDATHVVPAIVVAVQRTNVAADDLDARQIDFTPGPAAGEPDSSRPTGGAAAFLEFIVTELVPVIERDFPADPTRRVLFGHSLAGYFALYALTARADAFAAYVAVSPSIWWDENRLRAGFERLRSRTSRVLIAVGEWEGELPPWQRQDPRAAETRARRARRRMIERAEHFAADLACVLGSANVAFHLFPDEDHASVVLVAISRALRFALSERFDAGGAGPASPPAQ